MLVLTMISSDCRLPGHYRQLHRELRSASHQLAHAPYRQLDAPLDLTWEARSCLNEVLGKVAPPETWGFVMLNPEQQRLVLRAINRGEKPSLTLRIWNAAISHIRYDTGEIMAGRKRLAEDADTTPEEASRAPPGSWGGSPLEPAAPIDAPLLPSSRPGPTADRCTGRRR
jgi:hypothetical protein